jgi:hypothetical protein
MKMSIGLVLLVVPSVALAGSMNRVCEIADKSVVMADGNRIQIKLADKSTFETSVSMQLDFGNPDAEVIAVPITAERYTARDHKEMHVRHKADGSRCEGRQSWDDRSTQSYLLMAKDGESLMRLLKGPPVKKLTKDGYLVAEFQCHAYGVTSPGGCRVEDPDDEVVWVPIKPAW